MYFKNAWFEHWFEPHFMIRAWHCDFPMCMHEIGFSPVDLVLCQFYYFIISPAIRTKDKVEGRNFLPPQHKH